MDTLTHTVLGACLGEAIAGKKLGKKAMLIGVVANNFPDIDVLSTFFTGPVDELLVHRGITHSILACSIVTMLAAWLLSRKFQQALSFRKALWLTGSGLYLHILLDACTSYGTGWFEPFSNYRVSFNLLFILDPLFMLPLLVAAIILTVLKKNSPKRKWTATSALVLSSIYFIATMAIKTRVRMVIESSLSRNNVPCDTYMVAPAPLNNILWNVIAQDGSNCYIGYYSILDNTEKITYEKFPKCDSLLAAFPGSADVEKLKRFSKNFYCVSKTDSSVIFSDLRFGQIGGWYMPHAPFVFNFDIRGRNDATHIQQGRVKAVRPEAIGELLRRIRGI